MENYAPGALNPAQRSFQAHDAPLGSSSASPAHSYQHSLQSRWGYHDTINQLPTSAILSEDNIGREQNSLDFPSVSQQAALTALQDYDNGTIFAWLTGFRSFRPGRENWFQPGYLSSQQLEAISALKDCADSLVSAWLDFVRNRGNFDTPHSYYGGTYFAVHRTAVTPTRNAWQGSSNTSRSSSSSFGPSASLYDSCTNPSTQGSSCSRGTLLDLSQEPSIDETAATVHVAGAHTHWCFVCENHRVFTTCDGWKRHMKEHETRYHCIPQGHEIYTANGPQCALCGGLNPDERHYKSHKILSCSNKTLIARSYTRKSHLINHLKTHGISDGSALVEAWRDTLEKKYFSCGFCTACFHSHTDQLNHIDSAHYKNHQHISEWDSNKIILGLLLQPGVQQSWQDLLTANPRYNDSGFRWSPTAVKSLQLRLEKSEETANNLALAAFDKSTCDWRQNGRIDSMPVAGFSDQDMNAHQNMPIIQPQATPAQMGYTRNQSSFYDGGVTNSIVEAQYPAWRSIATNHLNSGMLNANPTAHQNNSSQESMVIDRHPNTLNLQLGLPSSSSNGWAPPQPPSRAPSNGSTTTNSDAFGGETAILISMADDGNGQASSSPKAPAGHSGHPNQNNSSAGRNCTTTMTQATSSGFNYPASPLTQAGSFPRRHRQSSLPARSTKQPSRTKLKDHYDIDTEADMDIDLDDLQYFMREEGHTRSGKQHR